MSKIQDGTLSDGREAFHRATEAVNFADAMDRYDRSCDEMRTLRLNPLKAIPLDQYPEETQLRGSAIVRQKNTDKYARYVLRVAVQNDNLAGQARLWWAWWEKKQAEPSRAGPAPLVSREIEGALRVASARRGAEAPMVVSAATADAAKDVGTLGSGRRVVEGGERRPLSGRRPSHDAIDRTACGILRDALKAAHDAGESYLPTRTEITRSVTRALKHPLKVETLFATKRAPEGQAYRYPEFMALWTKTRQHGKDARRARVARES